MINVDDVIPCHDCIHQPFFHSCLLLSPSSDYCNYSINCFIQIYKSRVELVSFTPIFLLYLLYGKNCISNNSFPGLNPNCMESIFTLLIKEAIHIHMEGPQTVACDEGKLSHAYNHSCCVKNWKT